MSISSKPKPNIHYKKRSAQHHRHSKTYLKTYWPYLPVILIFGFGIVLGYLLPHPTPTYTRPVAFNQSGIWETAIGGIALALFLARHGFAWHKVWIKGEEFAIKHPMLDIALAVIATGGILLGYRGALI